MAKKPLSYRDAGVDIDQANAFIEQIKPLVRRTARRGVSGGIGGFGGLFHFERDLYRNPVLVAATDGVGTKLLIAQEMDRHETVGIDLVAMSVNDLIVQGAEPLFFLDYIAVGTLDAEQCTRIVQGIVQGCIEAGCALIGGETAEMPGLYRKHTYDLAGFCVGVVEQDAIIDGSDIRVGDRIIGLASNGLHSNGFSLARAVFFERHGLKHSDTVEGLDHSLGEELLRPTRIYVKSILNLIRHVAVSGIVHVTGGGFYDNIPRILHPSLCARIEKNSWKRPAIFDAIRTMGDVEDKELFRVFNMGIGMMVIIHEEDLPDALDRLAALGETASPIGVVEQKPPGGAAVVIV